MSPNNKSSMNLLKSINITQSLFFDVKPALQPENFSNVLIKVVDLYQISLPQDA